MMSVEEWNALVNDIGASTADQAAMTTLLNKASMEYAELFATSEENRLKREEIEKENGDLKKANWEFFTQLGEQRRLINAGSGAAVQQEENKSRAETITVADLFKKGEK